MTSWLPERLNDLIYRMDTQYQDEGLPKSSDYIYVFEDNDNIIGCILPDGDSIHISLKNEYESLIPNSSVIRIIASKTNGSSWYATFLMFSTVKLVIFSL